MRTRLELLYRRWSSMRWYACSVISFALLVVLVVCGEQGSTSLVACGRGRLGARRWRSCCCLFVTFGRSPFLTVLDDRRCSAHSSTAKMEAPPLTLSV